MPEAEKKAEKVEKPLDPMKTAQEILKQREERVKAAPDDSRAEAREKLEVAKANAAVEVEKEKAKLSKLDHGALLGAAFHMATLDMNNAPRSGVEAAQHALRNELKAAFPKLFATEP